MRKREPLYDSAAWRAVREIVLRRDGRRCVICHADVSGKGKARVDHVKRVADGGAQLDIANLRTLCAQHDNQGHREKGSGGAERVERFAIRGATATGMPLDPAHPWRRESNQ